MNLQEFYLLLLFSSLPGAIGGISTFLFSMKNGHYKNNRYKAKLSVEILGGAILATFIAPLFPGAIKIQLFTAFIVGLMWAGIIQVIRNKITQVVKAFVGEELK